METNESRVVELKQEMLFENTALTTSKESKFGRRLLRLKMLKQRTRSYELMSRNA